MLAINNLPLEMLTAIHFYLDDIQDIGNAEQVSKFWRQIMHSFQWKRIANALPQEEVETALLPNYKAVCKEWYTVDQKIQSLLTGESKTIMSPLNTPEGMLKIIRRICGKKRYDNAHVIEGHDDGIHVIPEKMSGHAFAKGIDSCGRHFICIRFQESLHSFALSHIFLREGHTSYQWEMYGNITQIPFSRNGMNAIKLDFEISTLKFIQELMNQREAKYNGYLFQLKKS